MDPARPGAMDPTGPGAIDPVDAERAGLFALLGQLLSAPPDAALLAGLAALRGDASPLGQAIAGLAAAAGSKAGA